MRRDDEVIDALLFGGIGALSLYYIYLKLKESGMTWQPYTPPPGGGGGTPGGGGGGPPGGGGGGGQPPVIYKVYVYVRPEGWGTTDPQPGVYEVNANTQFSIEAIEVSDQYVFDRWEVTIGNKTQTYYDKSISVIVTDNTMIIAYFKKAPEPEKYTLSIGVVPPGAGYTYPNVGDYEVESGTQYNIRAYAEYGYEFRAFEVIKHLGPAVLDADLIPHGSVSITVDRDYRVNAHFMSEQAGMYQSMLIVQTDPLDEKWTVPQYGRYDVDTGSQVTLEAKPPADWEFKEWLVITPISRRTYSDKRITIEIVDDTLVIARFEPIEFIPF